jgi:hypothetical protein
LRSLLAHCEREAFIVQRLLAKIYHTGCWIFPSYIIRHIARQRKKPRLWHLQGGCNYELFLRNASLSQWRSLLAQWEREAFIVQRLLAKMYHPGRWIFFRYIIRHIARQRKKTRTLALTGKLQLWAKDRSSYPAPTVGMYIGSINVGMYVDM